MKTRIYEVFGNTGCAFRIETFPKASALGMIGEEEEGGRFDGEPMTRKALAESLREARSERFPIVQVLPLSSEA